MSRLSASPHQTLDMMILLEINDREWSFTVSHPYYEGTAFIYSKGAISERVGDNLCVSLYKCMLYIYQVISLPLPNVRYDEVSLNKWYILVIYCFPSILWRKSIHLFKRCNLGEGSR